MRDLTREQQQILGLLTSRGIATSRELQEATGRSQPTISRLLGGLPVIALGAGRSTRYGLPRSIRGLSARQPLLWTSETGLVRRVGTATLLADDVVHVEVGAMESISHGMLPWYLSTLRAEGFLGRLHAQRLALQGVPSSPDSWDGETHLFAALHLQDAPGALTLGDPASEPIRHPPLPADAGLGAALDAISQDVARTLPAGSSAGGEQPKFLALLESGQHVLVKFSPPARTPFGDRWADLLQAECLAARVLAEHGVPVATNRIVTSSQRTYLLSDRFDRVGARGRRHAVSVGAAHRGFVHEAYSNWSETCAALAGRGHLSAEDAARALALQHFGRLIGNSDMHSGNLALFVDLDGLEAGRFVLAPVYDMLPMRWRPDPSLGGAPDYAPFEPDSMAAGGPALGPARAFWEALSDLESVGGPLRQVAREMSIRLR